MGNPAVLSRYGLGQLVPSSPIPAPAPATVPSDPLAARLAAAFGTPLVQAFSQRIAYGQGGPAYPLGGGYYYPTDYGGGVFGFQGFSQSTLFLGAVAIGAFLLLSKR